MATYMKEGGSSAKKRTVLSDTQIASNVFHGVLRSGTFWFRMNRTDYMRQFEIWRKSRYAHSRSPTRKLLIPSRVSLKSTLYLLTARKKLFGTSEDLSPIVLEAH